MKYTDETKNTVQVESRSVPRGHRLWFELEIDKAEEAGTIEPFKSARELIVEEIARVEAAGVARRTQRLQREARIGLEVTLPDGSTMLAADHLRQIDEETDGKILELREKL